MKNKKRCFFVIINIQSICNKRLKDEVIFYCVKEGKEMMTGALFQKIENWLEENNWSYESRRKAGIIEMNMGLTCELRRCQVIVWMKDGKCTVMGRVPVKVEKGARERVAEYFCRVNYGLYSGHFDLNYSDGELRSKTYLAESADEEIQKDNIGDALVCPAMMFDIYGPGLLEVWRKEKTPTEVMEEIYKIRETEDDYRSM